MTFHEDLLNHLLAFRKEHPDFNFIPRQRNKKQRFEQGYWFPGEESYAFVGLLNNPSINMTRSIGLVFWKDDNYLGCTLEVITKGVKDEKLLKIHNSTLDLFDDFKEQSKDKFSRFLGDTSKGYDSLLEKAYQIFLKIKSFVSTEEIDKDLILSNQKFDTLIKRINSYRKSNKFTIGSRCILANITWNSNDWKEISTDSSNHAYVKEGNTPNESWNFDKKASWNSADRIYGYAQFTNKPSETDPPIIIFYSDGKIVGFYGDAKISDFDLEGSPKNLSGKMDLSFVLEKKINDIKEKGFLEGKERIGQTGFNYLVNRNNILAIIDEAIRLNTNQATEIKRLKQWYVQRTVSKLPNKKSILMENSKKLNRLFFGPPGTGKTYKTISEAIKIIDPVFYEENEKNRTEITQKFRELLIKDWTNTKGQIVFCTFHQSFSYEDFVEGIKPKTSQDKQIYYEIEDGIFKKLCDEANSSKSAKKIQLEGKLNWSKNEFHNRKAFFYKLSLGEANNPEDREIYEFCRDNNYISIGFGGNFNFLGLSETEIKEKCIEFKDSDSAGSQLSTFIHGLSIGDYVVISKGNKFLRALARVTGAYEYHDDFPIGYSHFRKVEWIFVDESIPVEDFYNTKFTQRSIYKIDHEKLKEDFFITDGVANYKNTEEEKSYVIIIDEINRGNIASIFGELITLIEPDKRSGSEEALSVTLPYSKNEFSVPDNVFIIGTMNTADRSVEALDSALRRRFYFSEVMPDYHIIEKVLGSKNNWHGIQISDILRKINKRITVLIDRDHQIGHSYFLKLKNATEKEINGFLKIIFSENIIPLLQEYFFNDFNKIGLVIGEGFLKINRKEENENLFAVFQEDNDSDYEEDTYHIHNPKNMNDQEFITAIELLINE
jgi:hypothetical protein